jgi:hypothetical protein
MSEPKNHWQITDADGALVFTLRFTTTASWLATVTGRQRLNEAMLVANLLHHRPLRSVTMGHKLIGNKMYWLGRILISALSVAVSLATTSARAETKVGEAVIVKNEVLRVATAATSQINVGDGLLRDETVRTGTDSATRLVMIDSTNLSLGPNASLKLDRTVFNDEHSYRDIAIRLTTGAFRFVTGHSEKTAYKITTPLATIGVRGTILDILSQRGQTIVVLQEGASRVCATSGQCIELTQPGDTAIITSAGGKVRITKANVPPWTFAAACAAAAGLCTVSDFADASPTLTPSLEDALCGR